MLNTEWTRIPGGTTRLAEGGYLALPCAYQLKPFAIGRFPVTNAQYARFVATGGYENSTWWTPAGWRLREKEGWIEPRHWQNEDWNRPTCPVVGVSWYEALAYCAWLSSESGQAVTLPSEQQWQRAAQGNDSRVYPWGNAQPGNGLCNWNRTVDETTPVNSYPEGASPFGVMDMSGNVWEWCLTGWRSGTLQTASPEPRLLRGGSWSSDSPLSLRAGHREAKDPNTRLDPGYRHHVTVGFRCVTV